MISKRNMRFPARCSSIVFHSSRKLFAHSFLLPVTPLCFIAAGNFSHIISCSPWLHCVSWRQETFQRGDFSTPLCSARNDGSDVVPLYFIAALLPFDKLFHLWYSHYRNNSIYHRSSDILRKNFTLIPPKSWRPFPILKGWKSWICLPAGNSAPASCRKPLPLPSPPCPMTWRCWWSPGSSLTAGTARIFSIPSILKP